MVFVSGYYDPSQDKMIISVQEKPRPKADEIWVDLEDGQAAEIQKRLDEANTITVMQCEMTQSGCDKGISIWAENLNDIEICREASACDLTVLIDGDDYEPFS